MHNFDSCTVYNTNSTCIWVHVGVIICWMISIFQLLSNNYIFTYNLQKNSQGGFSIPIYNILFYYVQEIFEIKYFNCTHQIRGQHYNNESTQHRKKDIWRNFCSSTACNWYKHIHDCHCYICKELKRNSLSNKVHNHKFSHLLLNCLCWKESLPNKNSNY